MESFSENFFHQFHPIYREFLSLVPGRGVVCLLLQVGVVTFGLTAVISLLDPIRGSSACDRDKGS